MHKGIRYRLSPTILIDSGKVVEQKAITTPAKAITNPIHIKVLYCDSVSEWCKDFFKRISVAPHKTMQDNVNRNQIIFFPKTRTVLSRFMNDILAVFVDIV